MLWLLKIQNYLYTLSEFTVACIRCSHGISFLTASWEETCGSYIAIFFTNKIVLLWKSIPLQWCCAEYLSICSCPLLGPSHGRQNHEKSTTQDDEESSQIEGQVILPWRVIQPTYIKLHTRYPDIYPGWHPSALLSAEATALALWQCCQTQTVVIKSYWRHHSCYCFL